MQVFKDDGTDEAFLVDSFKKAFEEQARLLERDDVTGVAIHKPGSIFPRIDGSFSKVGEHGIEKARAPKRKQVRRRR